MPGLEIRLLPLKSKDVDVHVVWTRIAGEHAAHKWLRQQLLYLENELIQGD